MIGTAQALGISSQITDGATGHAWRPLQRPKLARSLATTDYLAANTGKMSSTEGPAAQEPAEATMAAVLKQLLNMGAQLEKMDARLEKMDARLNKLDAQQEKLGVRMDALDAQMGALEERMTPQSRSSPLASGGSKTPTQTLPAGGAGSAAAVSQPPPAGGGSSSSSGTSSPRSAPLRRAYAASLQPAIALSPGCSRGMPAALQSRLMAHRLCTDPRVSEFDYAALGPLRQSVAPNPERGLSLFVVASEDTAVVAAAHAARGAATKAHRGCVSWRLDTLPPALVLTLDRVLEKSAGGEPIVWHATLSPSAAMTYAAYLAAVEAWGGVVVCELRGNERDGKGEGEGEGEGEREGEAMKEHLCTFSASTAPYALAKLSAHAAAQAQAAGGSPGTRSPGAIGQRLVGPPARPSTVLLCCFTMQNNFGCYRGPTVRCCGARAVRLLLRCKVLGHFRCLTRGRWCWRGWGWAPRAPLPLPQPRRRAARWAAAAAARAAPPPPPPPP